VAPHVVDHLVHAVAELLDNATSYSTPGSAVVVQTRRVAGQVIVEIGDRGLGMAPATVDAINDRLARPPLVDLPSLTSTGLATVATIAAWHGLRVRVANRVDGPGVVATVVLPREVLIQAPRHLRPEPREQLAPPAWPLTPRPLDRRPGAGGNAATQLLPAVNHTATAGAVAASAARRGLAAGPEAVEPGPSAAITVGPDSTEVAATGLPHRQPMAHLASGHVAEADPGPGVPERDPRRVAAAMRNYQRGLRQGRAATAVDDDHT